MIFILLIVVFLICLSFQGLANYNLLFDAYEQREVDLERAISGLKRDLTKAGKVIAELEGYREVSLHAVALRSTLEDEQKKVSALEERVAGLSTENNRLNTENVQCLADCSNARAEADELSVRVSELQGKLKSERVRLKSSRTLEVLKERERVSEKAQARLSKIKKANEEKELGRRTQILMNQAAAVASMLETLVKEGFAISPERIAKAHSDAARFKEALVSIEFTDLKDEDYVMTPPGSPGRAAGDSSVSAADQQTSVENEDRAPEAP